MKPFCFLLRTLLESRKAFNLCCKTYVGKCPPEIHLSQFKLPNYWRIFGIVSVTYLYSNLFHSQFKTFTNYIFSATSIHYWIYFLLGKKYKKSWHTMIPLLLLLYLFLLPSCKVCNIVHHSITRGKRL